MAQSDIDSLKKILTATPQEDSNKVQLLLQLGKKYMETDPNLAIEYAGQAKDAAAKINYKRGMAMALKDIGLGYYTKGKNAETLENWQQSLLYFDSIADRSNVARLLSNIGAVYFNNGAEAKSVEYHLKSLKVAEEIKDTLRIATAMNNLAAVYMMKKATYSKAKEYFLKVLPMSERLGDKDAIGNSAVNLGEIYFKMGNNDTALFYYKKSLEAYKNTVHSAYTLNDIGKLYTSEGEFELAKKYHQQAFEISKKLSAQQDMSNSLLGLADVYSKQNNFSTALTYYKQAEEIAKEIRAADELKNSYQGLSFTFSELSDFRNAFKYQLLLSDIKDTLYNTETDKKLGSLQFDFDLQKKQGEINLLTKDKLYTALQLESQKKAKNAFAAGLGLVFLIALLIFRNYREKVKTNKILDQQKDEIEHLLLNILPAEVAKELQVHGQATPRNFESVSVMFTDFRSFTVIADKMTPQDLVEELNKCFIAFDQIIGKYNLEKIKTIGDAYMCAGGIPSPDSRHAYNMVRASLEIQEYIIENNRRKVEAGLEAWDLRLGLHVGPIVAGVVGKRKYAYDIWGSTVNIASRMESNGEPGRVNISASTYEIIKDEFECSYRGKIYAKNVGDIDMYFVEREIIPSTADNQKVNTFAI
jgi:class 3 adenylate cyclase/tetratricopeptide (TPR) repeat protein